MEQLNLLCDCNSPRTPTPDNEGRASDKSANICLDCFRSTSKSSDSNWTPDKHTPEVSSEDEYDNISVNSEGSSFSLANVSESEREESLRDNGKPPPKSMAQTLEEMPRVPERFKRWLGGKESECKSEACAERLRDCQQMSQATIEKLEENLEKLQKDHDNLQSNHLNLQVNHAKLESDREKLQDEYDYLQEDHDSLQNALEDLDNEHDELKTENEKLVDRLKLEDQDHRKVKENHLKDVTQLREELRELQNQHDTIQNEHSLALQVALEEVLDYQIALKETREREAKQGGDIQKFTNEASDQAAVISKLEADLQEYKERIQMYEEKIQKLEGLEKYLKEDIHRLTEECAELQTKVSNTADENLKLQDANSSLTLARDAAMHAHGMQIAAHDDTGLKLRKEIHKNQELQDELLRAQEHVLKCTNQLESLERLLGSLAKCDLRTLSAEDIPDTAEVRELLHITPPP